MSSTSLTSNTSNGLQEDDYGIMAMKRRMLRSLKYQYSNIEQKLLCVLSTVVDQWFKLEGFLTASSAAHARMFLLTEWEAYLDSFASQNDQPTAGRRYLISHHGVHLMRCWLTLRTTLKVITVEKMLRSW